MHRLIPVAAALLAGGLGSPVFSHYRTQDLRPARRRDRASAAPADGITLVAIDDDSIRRMEPLVGRWPWPRLVHATVIDYLAAGGAKVIAYDILFAERDRRRFMVGDTEWTGEESDAALVDSTRKAGNVMHVAEAASDELVDPSKAVAVELDAPALNLGLGDGGCIEVRPGVTPPFPELAQASRAIGHTLLMLDSDGPMRRTPPLVRVGDRTIPSFVAARPTMASRARGRSSSPRSVPDYRGNARALVPWRGPAQNAGGHPTFTSYPSTICSGRSSRSSKARRRKSIRRVPGSHRDHRRDRARIGDVFTTSFPEGRSPARRSTRTSSTGCWQTGQSRDRPGWARSR